MTTSAISQSLARLGEEDQRSATRFVDLQLGLECYATGERLLTVGGVWDRREKRYVGAAKTEHVIRIQPAQMEAARWLCEWMRRFALARRLGSDADARAEDTGADAEVTDAGAEVTNTVTADDAWRDFAPVWSVLFHGGRRGGKSHLACVALAVFAVMVPGSLCWAVSPTEEKTEELRSALASLLPSSWYRYVKNAMTFTLANWARVVQRSGHKYENLKAGGVGLAVYNEGQQMSESGFLQLRGATADTGSLTIVTANPPDRPFGERSASHGTNAGSRPTSKMSAPGGERRARSFSTPARIRSSRAPRSAISPGKPMRRPTAVRFSASSCPSAMWSSTPGATVPRFARCRTDFAI